MDTTSNCERIIPLIGVDFELFKAAALMLFIGGVALIPIIAFGHLLKFITASTLTFYEFSFVRNFLKAEGCQPDSPAYNKIMKRRHISATITMLVRMFHHLNRAFALQYLEERGDSTFGSTARRLRAELASAASERPDSAVLVDDEGRARLALTSPWLRAISLDFEHWAYAKAGFIWCSKKRAHARNTSGR